MANRIQNAQDSGQTSISFSDSSTTAPLEPVQPFFLAVDTETTGLPRDWKAGWDQVDNWPRIVQIAWVLYDANGQPLEEQVHIVAPDGFEIPVDASNVHGITTERARSEGKPLAGILEQFAVAVGRAEWMVAHNMSYDAAVIAAEFHRFENAPPFAKSQLICTKEDGTDVAQILNAYNGYKWPTLPELYEKLFEEGFDGAHDALVDVKACARCFFKMKENGQIRALRNRTVL